MIRVHQTADGWTVEVTGHMGPSLFRHPSPGCFSLELGQHEVAVVGRQEPEPDTEEALRDGIAKLNAEKVPLYRLESLRGLTDVEARREAAGDSFTEEREWWIRRAQREAAAAALEMAEAVEREKNLWIDQVDAAEREERARCLAWMPLRLRRMPATAFVVSSGTATKGRLGDLPHRQSQ